MVCGWWYADHGVTGALRDLECQVQFIRVGEDGRVQNAYEAFGVTTKLRFNPVYDDAPDIEDRYAVGCRL